MNILFSKLFKSPLTVFLTSLSLLKLCPTEVNAAITTTGCTNTNTSCTLQELFDGGTITIDDTLFDNWLFVFTIAGPTFPDVSLIEIFPLDDQPLNPGFRFNFNDQVVFDDFGQFDFDLSYKAVTLNDTLKIKDNSLELTDFTFGGASGSVAIQETVRDTFLDTLPGNEPNEGIIGQKLVFADRATGEQKLSDSVVFSPQSLIAVSTSIDVLGGSGSVRFNGFEQRFSQELISQGIPEPSTGLFAFSLVGLGSLAWKKGKR